MNFIHIFTLSWNGLDKLKKLLPTLEDAIRPLNMKAVWYVRDNGSSDGTKEWLEGLDSEVLKIKPLIIGHNRDNFATGVNSLYLEALQYTALPDSILHKTRAVGPSTQIAIRNDFILLLNNDVEFGDTTSLVNMMKLMGDPDVAAVGARLLYSGTNKLQHAGVIFGPRYGNMPFHFRHGEEADEESKKNRYFQAVTAACCLIRAKDFMQMDTGFNWAFEDIDLMLRIGKNKKIAYCGDTIIYHEESASLKKNPVNQLFLQPNVKRFKEKWFGKYELDHEKYLKRPNYKIIK